MVATHHRLGSLPVHSHVSRPLPRKVILQRQRLAGVAVVILVLVFFLLKYTHHARPPQLLPQKRSGSNWPSISPRESLSQMPETPRNIYYLTKEDVLYCYIPKNACSRFKPLMRKREGFADWHDRSLIHGKNGLQRLNWLSRSQALGRLRDPAMKKFVVVRDPFSRLVSAYQNKVATPWPDQREDFWNKHLRNECPGMIDSRQMPKEGPLLTLEDFLKCLLAPDNLEPSNEHWRPQTQLCGLEYIKYDSYLHLETLVEDVTGLLETLNWKENTTEFEMHRNPVYSKNLADYFSDEAIKLAMDYYADDFDILQYPVVPSGTIDFYSVFDGTNFLPGFVPPVGYESQDGNVVTEGHSADQTSTGGHGTVEKLGEDIAAYSADQHEQAAEVYQGVQLQAGVNGGDQEEHQPEEDQAEEHQAEEHQADEHHADEHHADEHQVEEQLPERDIRE